MKLVDAVLESSVRAIARIQVQLQHFLQNEEPSPTAQSLLVLLFGSEKKQRLVGAGFSTLLHEP